MHWLFLLKYQGSRKAFPASTHFNRILMHVLHESICVQQLVLDGKRDKTDLEGKLIGKGELSMV